MSHSLRFVFFAMLTAFLAGCAHRQQPVAAARPEALVAAPASQPDEIVARIREEGLKNSKVMDTLAQLCDVIGPRLTGSPQAKRANEWTRDTLGAWGLSNAHLESWGPFGRGWSLRRFSIQVIEPYAIVLHGYPRAWSPGFERPIEAPAVFIDAQKEAELAQYKGRLKGAIVLISPPREMQARFEPLATRLKDEELSKLADAGASTNALMGQTRTATAAGTPTGAAPVNRRGGRGATRPTTRASTQSTQPTSRPGHRRFDPFAGKLLQFVVDEGAILVITSSSQGDGETFFVQSASIPGDSGLGGPATEPSTNRATAATAPATSPTTRPRVWSKDAPKVPPQLTLAGEDYNRLVKMLKAGEKLKMAVDLRVNFHDDDEMAYNTIAEIPGTDPELKDQIVMVGAHLDSWHAGTGATDNGAGSAAAMEAVRIIRALDLKPRRTIRVALWTGEEEGIYGSAAYVKEHFGYDPDPRGAAPRPRRPVDSVDAPEPDGGRDNPATQPAAPPRRLIKKPDYENLSVYFNLDNGTGKIRGIYAQGNKDALPLFRQWMAPFADLGATTVTLANTGSTDHVSFDRIGLPGFQFIQDPIEYNSRTHHSNEDVYDRIQAEDMKQVSTILAAFVWKAANMDERFPRKATSPATQPAGDRSSQPRRRRQQDMESL